MGLLHRFFGLPNPNPNLEDGLARGVYQLWHAVNLDHKLPEEERKGEYLSGMYRSRTYFALLPTGADTLVAKVVNEASIVGRFGPLSVILSGGALFQKPTSRVTPNDIFQVYPVQRELPEFRPNDRYGLSRALKYDTERVLGYLRGVHAPPPPLPSAFGLD